MLTYPSSHESGYRLALTNEGSSGHDFEFYGTFATMRDQLDKFSVDWGTSTIYDFSRPKRRKNDVAQPPAFLKALFEWRELHNTGWKMTGARFKDLYESQLDISDDDWVFARPLGKGGFGVAALFRKYRFGQIDDEIVIKDVSNSYSSQVNEKPGKLPREALIMAQTNALASESLLRLRAFRYFDHEEQYRYFLESCEHGDLERLRIKYKAWQLYPPELFLWHLLSWYSEAQCNMTDGPFRSLQSRDSGVELADGYLIHRDIKTENGEIPTPHRSLLLTPSVFLGRRIEHGILTDIYPIPKVADFGLATFVSPTDRDGNRARDMQGGTWLWKPPETRTSNMSHKWRFADQPAGDTDPDERIITTQANLFSLAATIWTFMTGSEIEELSTMINGRLASLSPSHFEYLDPLEPITKNGSVSGDEYSAELRHLIRDCLKLSPTSRPHPIQFWTRVRKGLKNCIAGETAKNKNNPTLSDARLQVYYRANEINDVSSGTANFDLDTKFWQRFVQATLFIPEDWGVLLPPTLPEVLEHSNQAALRPHLSPSFLKSSQNPSRCQTVPAPAQDTSSLPSPRYWEDRLSFHPMLSLRKPYQHTSLSAPSLTLLP